MKKIKNKLFYIYSFLLYLILATIAFVLSTMFLELDARSFFISNFSSRSSNSNNSVIIVVDQTTLNKYDGKWKRENLTNLLEYLDTYVQPKVIGLDSLISGINPNSKNDEKFLKQVSKMDNLVVALTPAKDDDENTINLKEFEKKYAINILGNEPKTKTSYKYISKVDPNMFTAKNFASVMIKSENKIGTVFTTPNLININEKYYASLPLKMYMVANGTNDISIDEKFITIPKTNVKIPHNSIKNGEIETNINYYNAMQYTSKNGEKSVYNHYTIPAYKALEIHQKLKSGEKLDEIESYIHENLVSNKPPIFIGAFADGTTDKHSDVVKTPLSSRHPGVDVQATIYNNIEKQEFLSIESLPVKILTIIVITLLTFLCVFRLSFIKSIISIILIDGAFFLLTAISAVIWYIIDFSSPIAIQLVTLIFGYSFKFISENRNKEKIKQAMGKYLSKDIMQNVVSNIDDLKLGGKRAIVTVLFSDIRGFTSLSEKMTAEEVSVILNEYFAEMEPIISKYNGVINKFIGDAVMAIFGEPIQDINHPQNAVKCAYEMLKKVEYLREKWLFEGKPKIEIGVGINTGEVFIGNIGTENRMEYTVIGDTVNLASRIESYNKVYKTNLLVSSSTYSHIADIADVIKINEVQIRGKAKKMNIYEVLRIDSKK